ncbi:radical SAM protein [bacterium]|nr:radical SAM protein [bacterium]MBR1776133.1 radical SAM protein [bacterium]
MDIRIANIIKKTKVEGPGIRYCIWVQGCTRHCKGCYATHTWAKNGGQIYKTENIIQDILNQNGIEGVTFLGGEPFEQSEALGEIADTVQKSGLSVVCFTGNIIENLKKEKVHEKLLNNIDLLIDGAFEVDKLDYSRPWCGSSNQRYHFFTDRYNKEIFTEYKNKVEVNISKNGVVFVNGMGNFNEILQKIDLSAIKK